MKTKLQANPAASGVAGNARIAGIPSASMEVPVIAMGGQTFCYRTADPFDRLCERAQAGYLPHYLVYLGSIDIVISAVARSIYFLDGAGRVLEKGDLENQAYIMVGEQLVKWDSGRVTFRQYLGATLSLRLHRYIDSVRHRWGKQRTKEISVPSREFTGDYEEDEPSILSVEDRLSFSKEEDPWSRIFVLELLSRLPDRHRAILESHVFEGMTFEEIGQEIGITHTVVLDYYHRTIKWLRKYLTDPDSAGPFVTALTREEKVVHDKDVLAMARYFYSSGKPTEEAAVAHGFPRRVWRKTARLLREAGYLKTKALHGGGRRSFMTIPQAECLSFLHGRLGN